MRMYDLIAEKKTGKKLSAEEIRWMVQGFTDGKIPDYQMSAMLMAICFNGLDEEETLQLTLAMRDSGDSLDLSSVPGIKADKHSTGGVGDKTTLILAPLIASLGVPVAKMSGRGLGFTGGTIDKLECIPGFTTALPEETFLANVRKIGLALAGQTKNLAPADKKIYALRDVTATVDQMSLIASSIMSKKLAAGSDVIVLDVKTGSGAFMKSEADARYLAETMVKIGTMAGKKMAAVITDMDQPLGNMVGNTTEVCEAIEALSGQGPDDLMEVVYALGTQMLCLSGHAEDEADAQAQMEQAVSSGAAKEKFIEFVRAQGGDESYIRSPEKFKKAQFTISVTAECDGYITGIMAEEIGNACMLLGGGRAKKEDAIDPAVGIRLLLKKGASVQKGVPVAEIYANDRDRAKEAVERIRHAYRISQEPCDMPQMVHAIIRGVS